MLSELYFKIMRKLHYLKIKYFGLRIDFNIANDIPYFLEGDLEKVLDIISNEYPEEYIKLDFTSDILDCFHPLSKQSIAFMSVVLEALKNKEKKLKVVRSFVKYVETRNRMYIVHW